MENIYQKLKLQFPYLSDADTDKIIASGKIKMLRQNELFAIAGQRVTTIALVLRGLMRNYIKKTHKEDITIAFASQSQFIAPYTSAFGDMPATETTEAVTDSTLFVLDIEWLKELGLNSAAFGRMYNDLLTHVLQASFERVQDFTMRNPEERYLQLLDSYGYLINEAPLKHLATYLGITPESLSRIRKRIAQKQRVMVA